MNKRYVCAVCVGTGVSSVFTGEELVHVKCGSCVDLGFPPSVNIHSSKAGASETIIDAEYTIITDEAAPPVQNEGQKKEEHGPQEGA